MNLNDEYPIRTDNWAGPVLLIGLGLASLLWLLDGYLTGDAGVGRILLAVAGVLAIISGVTALAKRRRAQR